MKYFTTLLLCICFLSCDKDKSGPTEPSGTPIAAVKNASSNGLISYGSTYYFTSSDRDLRLFNDGGGWLKLNNSPTMTFSGAGAGSFTYGSSSSIPEHLAQGEHWYFTIHYNGTLRTTATVSIPHNGSANNPYIFTVKGYFPEIEVRVGSTIVPDSTGTVDLGSAVINRDSLSTQFLIFNIGMDNLNLLGAPLVTISGDTGGEFVIEHQPFMSGANPTRIGWTGGSNYAYFYVNCKPTSVGQKLVTITILNDDEDEGVYTFRVLATGI